MVKIVVGKKSDGFYFTEENDIAETSKVISEGIEQAEELISKIVPYVKENSIKDVARDSIDLNAMDINEWNMIMLSVMSQVMK